MASNYKNIVVLSGGVAFTLNDTFAVYNPTNGAINASVIGAIKIVDTGAYVDTTAAQTIAVQGGTTMYGRFTSVSGDGLICMY